MQKIISVKHTGDKNLYHFLEYEGAKVGDKVVISLDDFETIGTVERILGEVDKEKAYELPSIKRVATAADQTKYEELLKKAKGNLKEIKKKSYELGLVMKFVFAEYSLDNSKIMITFSSEERVDFRQLLKELASMLKTRIELKQIGQRDEIKVTGGVGPCGEPCCCARFLNDFDHVTVKMAKVQGLSLSPTKINGICGRLMCCLGYESDTYDALLANMPKINSEVITPNGKGIVVYNDLLRERVSVKRQTDAENFVVEDFAIEELSVAGKKLKPLVREEKSKEEKQEVKAAENEKPKETKPFLSEDKASGGHAEERPNKNWQKNKENSKPKPEKRRENAQGGTSNKGSAYGIQMIDGKDASEVNAGDVESSKEFKGHGRHRHFHNNKKKFKN